LLGLGGFGRNRRLGRRGGRCRLWLGHDARASPWSRLAHSRAPTLRLVLLIRRGSRGFVRIHRF